MSNVPRRPGRHFLQIPGPSPVPDRVNHAIANAILDHRGPRFQELAHRVLKSVKTVFKTTQPVIIFPSSGTGAWEAALVNTLSPGDAILMVETGQFAHLWCAMARKLGFAPEMIETDWRTGAEANRIEARLREDKSHTIKAVCVVHNETSTGCRTWVNEVRAGIDATRHPALLMVDAVSSLGSMDLRHDDWGIDVTVSGSQKGLMLPPGLAFTAVSQKALNASKSNKTLRAYWSWDDMLTNNANGFFPYTPATGLLYGLDEAILMLHEEGLETVFARHERHAEATRRAVTTWGLEIVAKDEKNASPVVTAVYMPEGHNADAFRKVVLETFDMSLGTGLSRLAGKAFRIGHLGDTNDLTIMGALSGVEMGLAVAGIPHRTGGAAAALAYLAETAGPAKSKAT